MPARAWWPGQDEEHGDVADRQFAPGGLTVAPKDEHWQQALAELPPPDFEVPAFPGLRTHDRPVGADLAAHMKLVKQRAWELANSGQVINTVQSIGAVRRG